MRISRHDAKRLGIEHLCPTTSSPTEKPDDGMNGLERAFFLCAQRQFNGAIRREPLKFRLAGRTWYTPDFVVFSDLDCGVLGKVYEVKGHMEDDAAVKIKVAAELYPEFDFVLITRPRREGWQCRNVTSRGISRDVWCPDWLA